MLVSFDNDITLMILMITILRPTRVPIRAMLAGAIARTTTRRRRLPAAKVENNSSEIFSILHFEAPIE